MKEKMKYIVEEELEHAKDSLTLVEKNAKDPAGYGNGITKR